MGASLSTDRSFGAKMVLSVGADHTREVEQEGLIS